MVLKEISTTSHRMGQIQASRKAPARKARILLGHGICSGTEAGSVGLGEGAATARKQGAKACKVGWKALVMPDLDARHQVISLLLSEDPWSLIFS